MEEQLKRFLEERVDGVFLENMLSSISDKKSKKYKFWEGISNATAKGTRKIKRPALMKLSADLGKSNVMDLIPSDMLRDFTLGVSKDPVQKDVKELTKGFTDNYNIPTSQEPLSSGEDLEGFREAFRENYNEAYRTKDNASKVPQNASVKTKRTTQDPIQAPARENPNDKALEGFKKELAETLSSFGNEKLKESVSSWNKTKEDNFSDFNLQKQERINNFLNDFKDTLGPLYDTFQFIEQRKQEKEAMRVADRAGRQAPSTPAVRGENRILSNLIRSSQLANANPEQQLQPFKDQINLGYQQDLTNAQELSGGQAGSAVGLSQAAAIRRSRANEQIAPMAGDIFRKGLETTGALVGQQMQDDTWRDQQNIDIWRTRAANNLDLQRQAGMGVAMSRGRTLQARNNMYDSLLNSPVFDVETYMNLTKGNLQSPSI